MRDSKFYVTLDEFKNCTYDELEKRAAEQFKKSKNKSKALEEQEIKSNV